MERQRERRARDRDIERQRVWGWRPRLSTQSNRLSFQSAGRDVNGITFTISLGSICSKAFKYFFEGDSVTEWKI